MKSFILYVTLALASASAKASEQRIVTVGPWVTEAVFALGRGSVVVARDKASVVPAAASGLPSVGYHRQLAFEGLMSLRPTLVLASADAGPPHVLEQLRAAGVATVVLADASTLEQVSDFVMRVANAAGADLEQARTAAAEIQRGIERTRAKASAKADHPRVLALYARGPQVLSIIGAGTATAAIVEAAGGVQAVPNITGFKAMTAEAVLASRPDVLVLTTHGFQSLGGLEGLRAHPVLGSLACVKLGRVATLEDELVLGLGVRAARSIDAMSAALP